MVYVNNYFLYNKKTVIQGNSSSDGQFFILFCWSWCFYDILEIDREALFELFCNNPIFLQMYLELTSDRAFILGDKIKHYINKTIRESIMNYLNYESKKQNSNHIKLNITKKALAERIGVQRTSLSRELAMACSLLSHTTDSIFSRKIAIIDSPPPRA